MRNQNTLSLLAVAIVLVACGKAEKQSAAVTSPVARNLDIAPQAYTRMRFVSALEQSKGAVAMNAHHHATRTATRSHTVHAPDAIASMATHQLAVTTTSEVVPTQPAIVMASLPAPQPKGLATAVAAGDSYIDHSAEGDGLLAGLASHVVIRGGMVGEHKCDPRSEAQARGELNGRPNSSMPLMPTKSVFGGARR